MATVNGGAALSNSNNAPPSQPRGVNGDTDASRGRGRGGGNRNRGRGRGGGHTDGRRENSAAQQGGGPRRGGRDNRGGRGGGAQQPQPTTIENSGQQSATATPPKLEVTAGDDDEEEGEICFICANPVQHSSVAPCNHTTCHICALRMRALYKTKDCPICRALAPHVIFTDEATKRYDEYSPENITSTDENIGIRYASEEIVGDTILLLRYNCPDNSCDYAAQGWPDLHRHVRTVHHKKMCDLCTRNKKVFTHEHELFTDKALQKHMASGDDVPGAADQTGFRGHPLCGFCGERFYDDDKLYEHCRNKHERCFICDRRNNRQPHYYMNYNALEEHFKVDHYLCLDRECLEKKFVVFESEMDMKAHQLSEHANSLSKDVRRDARVVDMSGFDFRERYQQDRRRGHEDGGSNREGRGRGRGRDPNAEPLPRSSAQPLRRDEVAYQRQMAIHSAQSVTTRSFGGQLTSSTGSAGPNLPASRPNGEPSRQQPTQALARDLEDMNVIDTANMTPEDRARYVRHGAVIDRAANLVGNDSEKLAVFKAQISTYRKGQMTAPQLIDAFFALFTDTSATALGTLVRELADLFDEKSKSDALRKAWQDWRAINEDYPSLPGLGGMHGATTSSSGWANAAASSPSHLLVAAQHQQQQQQKHTTRVLKLKNSTRRGSATGGASSAPPPTGIASISWSAGSSSRAPNSSSAAFPALPRAGPAGSAAGSAASPMWIGSNKPIPQPSSQSYTTTASSSAATTARRAPVNGSSNGNGRSNGGGGGDAFPALPAAPKPQTTIFGYGRGAVRRDFGAGASTGFSWGAGAEGEQDGSATAAGSTGVGGVGGGEEAGKGKKKAKKVLVAWG